MSKRNMAGYERAYLILMTFIIVQLFLVFLNIHYTQKFPIETFTVVIVQLISILMAYFAGMIPAAVFAVAYVVGYIVYVMGSEGNITLVTYILMFFVPLSTIYAGNMHNTRKRIINDLVNLGKLEAMQLKIDPYTHLENEIAFKEVLSKHRNLGHRYPDYFFSVSMFRLEFIDTLRVLLDVKDFNYLLEQIAEVIQASIREEDYKFFVNNSRFVIITPLTCVESISPAIRRILEGAEKLNVIDRNGEALNITLKAGGLDYSAANHELFEDHNSVLLALQKTTEVDVHGEYDN